MCSATVGASGSPRHSRAATDGRDEPVAFGEGSSDRIAHGRLCTRIDRRERQFTVRLEQFVSERFSQPGEKLARPVKRNAAARPHDQEHIRFLPVRRSRFTEIGIITRQGRRLTGDAGPVANQAAGSGEQRVVAAGKSVEVIAGESDLFRQEAQAVASTFDQNGSPRGSGLRIEGEHGKAAFGGGVRLSNCVEPLGRPADSAVQPGLLFQQRARRDPFELLLMSDRDELRPGRDDGGFHRVLLLSECRDGLPGSMEVALEVIPPPGQPRDGRLQCDVGIDHGWRSDGFGRL